MSYAPFVPIYGYKVNNNYTHIKVLLCHYLFGRFDFKGEGYMNKEKVKALLGKRIRQLRQELGLTQDEASERAGTITEKRWSDIERGRYAVGLVTLFKIAGGLNVPLYEIFKFETRKSQKGGTDLLKRKFLQLEKPVLEMDKQMNILKRSIRRLRKPAGITARPPKK